MIDPLALRFPAKHEPRFVNLQVVDGKLVPAPWMGGQGPLPTGKTIYTKTEGPSQTVELVEEWNKLVPSYWHLSPPSYIDSRETAWG